MIPEAFPNIYMHIHVCGIFTYKYIYGCVHTHALHSTEYLRYYSSSLLRYISVLIMGEVYICCGALWQDHASLLDTRNIILATRKTVECHSLDKWLSVLWHCQ